MSAQHKMILVTGGRGFIGARVVAALVREGVPVVCLDQRPPPADMARRIEWIQGDLEDLATVREVSARVTGVCHAAAFIPPDFTDPEYAAQSLRVNGVGTLNLVRAACEAGVGRFVYFSTAALYDAAAKQVNETALLYPAEHATYYAAGKLAGELFVENGRRIHGLSAVTFRVGSVYGFGMSDRSVVARFMEQASHGTPLRVLNGGQAAFDYVYVDDIADLAVKAMKSGEAGIYNAGSGVATTVVQLAQAVADVYSDRQVKVELEDNAGSGHAGLPALSIEQAAAAWSYRPRALSAGLKAYRAAMEASSNACGHIQ